MRDVSANSVLLVDDDPTIRNFLSSQLQEAGFKAQQAEDGVASTPENKTVEQTAVCGHCEARVPFLVESAEAA